MKPFNVVIIAVLVIFCVGLLLAFNGPGKNTPAPQEQKVTGQEKHQIDLISAKRFIKNHGNSSSLTKASSVKGGFFARDAFEKILAQPGVIGIRYYFARTDAGMPTLVLVGVDGGGADLQTGFIAEMAVPCPPFCNEGNELAK